MNLPIPVCLVEVGNSELACISIQCTCVRNAKVGVSIGNGTYNIEYNIAPLVRVCLSSLEQAGRGMISKYDNEHEMLLLSFLASPGIAR